MHVPVQDMRVRCVQQMGTLVRVCVEARGTPTGTEMRRTRALLQSSLPFLLSTSPPANETHTGACDPLFSGEVFGSHFICFWRSIS